MRTAAAAWAVSLALLIGPINAPLGTHAVRGVVKAITASSLLITRPGRRAIDMAFVLTASTAREGSIAVGSTVSIRYITDGRTLVATAISASPEGACRGDNHRYQGTAQFHVFAPSGGIGIALGQSGNARTSWTSAECAHETSYLLILGSAAAAVGSEAIL